MRPLRSGKSKTKVGHSSSNSCISLSLERYPSPPLEIPMQIHWLCSSFDCVTSRRCVCNLRCLLPNRSIKTSHFPQIAFKCSTALPKRKTQGTNLLESSATIVTGTRWGQFTVPTHYCGLLLISHWSINPKGTRILGEKKVKRKRRVSLATNQSMTGQIVVVAAKTQARLQTKTTKATTSSREII